MVPLEDLLAYASDEKYSHVFICIEVLFLRQSLLGGHAKTLKNTTVKVNIMNFSLSSLISAGY